MGGSANDTDDYVKAEIALIELALKELGVPFLRAAVGDRNVLQLLRTHGGMLGGEASGHLLCLDKTTTGDGLIVALQVVAVEVEIDNVSSPPL